MLPSPVIKTIAALVLDPPATDDGGTTKTPVSTPVRAATSSDIEGSSFDLDPKEMDLSIITVQRAMTSTEKEL